MDRRAVSRIAVSGAQLKYKRLNTRNLIQFFSKRVPVEDLSKSGIGFITEEALEVGEKIAVKVFFPDGHHLSLKGQVRWREKDDSANCRMGLQFHPFGKGAHYNPLKALEYLRKLIPFAPLAMDSPLEA